jgi:hypothetical protein
MEGARRSGETAMKQLIELGAVRIGAAIQNICTNVDIDVLSLPGGSLIAVVLWLYASASGSQRRASAQAAQHVGGFENWTVSSPTISTRGPRRRRKELSPKRLKQGLSDLTINLERRRRAAVWRCRTDRCVRPDCSLLGCRRAKRYLGSRSAIDHWGTTNRPTQFRYRHADAFARSSWL